jgi:uncharacterized metal-binding protein YceD (DUF177 family)
MIGHREYDIPFVGLKPGIHDYDYEITDKFFTDYNEQDFNNCQASVKLHLEKNSGFMILKFDVGGTVDVVCDRCGNMLPLQLWDEFKIIVKMVDDADLMNEQEEDPDVYYINRTESHLHVSDWIYEFINLSIPTTRMCAVSEIGGPFCNLEVLEKLKSLQPDDNNANAIWKGLEKFKGLNE